VISHGARRRKPQKISFSGQAQVVSMRKVREDLRVRGADRAHRRGDSASVGTRRVIAIGHLPVASCSPASFPSTPKATWTSRAGTPRTAIEGVSSPAATVGQTKGDKRMERAQRRARDGPKTERRRRVAGGATQETSRYTSKRSNREGCQVTLVIPRPSTDDMLSPRHGTGSERAVSSRLCVDTGYEWCGP